MGTIDWIMCGYMAVLLAVGVWGTYSLHRKARIKRPLGRPKTYNQQKGRWEW